MSSDKLDLQDKLIAFKSLIKIVGAPIATMVTGDPFVPTGVTNLFLETFFGIQSELKMKRVHSFLEKLEKGIKEIDKDLDLEKVDKIEFGDLLETAIIKSTRQQQGEKIERFKSIIINQLVEPVEYDYAVKFFELVEKLNEKQLIVFSEFVGLEKEIKARVIERRKLEIRTGIRWKDEFVDVLKAPKFQNEVDQMSKLSNEINDLYDKKRMALDVFNADEKSFMQSELRAWGLIYNPAEGTFGDTGHFYDYSCTSLGIKFIESLGK
ncbi:hypothetical protein SAMN04487891_113111 [Flagellimonas taeanensis]|uniref:DUF4393 domain-containing protein n=1 Tax=Flagellimonas taeanensis TaxID=1005926 RepID=A0A1M6UK24_9FLAO|nr:hypothetical protein [Allomuricauda taeanensis]SFC55385.1 hypothetical protein SAMN04487891_113111 [Allomuricauda taeanensis]SHK69584.1 hypothetical protein SAMN05216293_1655 [Allomuricauda taeanensis]